MMGADGINYYRMLFEFFSKFITDQGMGTLNALIDCLTNIVKKTCTFCKVDIQPEFSSHDAGKVGNFNTMLKQILPVTGAVSHFSNMPDKVFVHRSEERRVGKECRSRW